MVLESQDAADVLDRKQVLPPETTAEQDRKTRGQRQINATWELMQAVIALAAIGTMLIVSATQVIQFKSEVAYIGLVGLAFLVTGFYFGRTNHTRIGDDSTKGDNQ